MDIQATAQPQADAAAPAGAAPAVAPPVNAAAPAPVMSLPPVKEGNGARGIIVGLGGIWVATGLYIAPIATLIWVVGVGSICLTASWWSRWLDGRVYERVGHGCCAQCGYDLRGCGQSGDCPECGAWFGLGWGAAIPAEKKNVLANATPAGEVAPVEPVVQAAQPSSPPPFEHSLAGSLILLTKGHRGHSEGSDSDPRNLGTAYDAPRPEIPRCARDDGDR